MLFFLNDRFKPYFGVSEIGPLRMTWSDRKRPWSEVMSWKYALRMPGFYPRFSSFYSSSTKCTIAHDRHGYRMWRDRLTSPEVTSENRKWGFLALFRMFSDIFEVFGYRLCCVVLLGCFLCRPRSHCGISTK